MGTRPPSSEAGAGETQGQRPSEWRKRPREALRWGKEPQNKGRIPSRPPGHTGTCPICPSSLAAPQFRPAVAQFHTLPALPAVLFPQSPPGQPPPGRFRLVSPKGTLPGHCILSPVTRPPSLCLQRLPQTKVQTKVESLLDDRLNIQTLSGSYACKDPALLPPSLPSAFPQGWGLLGSQQHWGWGGLELRLALRLGEGAVINF